MTATERPTVVLFSMGGTIAAAADDPVDARSYAYGVVSGEDLVASVPKLAELADVEVVEVTGVGSHDLEPSVWLDVSNQISRTLVRSEVAGVVVTHGTETLQDTAFFLQSTIDSDKPVVVTGAMRPGTSLSADGAMNLVQAVSVVCDPHASERGVLVVLNDRIVSAQFVAKTSAVALQAMTTPDQGFLGGFIGAEPFFYFDPARPVGWRPVDVSSVEVLPRVDIVSAFAGSDAVLLDVAVELADGVVVDAPGSGWPPTPVEERIRGLVAAGYPLVVTGSAGIAFRDPALGSSPHLMTARQARTALMLALTERA